MPAATFSLSLACHNRQMPTLPSHEDSLLVRTDFTDDTAWARAVEAAVKENPDGFKAYVVPVSDPAFDGAGWQDVRAAVPPVGDALVLFIADSTALAGNDYPFLVVDVLGEHRPFRCVASELCSVESNLNIANMDWEEFADYADEHGTYRG